MDETRSRHGFASAMTLGTNYRSPLDTYTSLTGRPALLPFWGYGLASVCAPRRGARCIKSLW